MTTPTLVVAGHICLDVIPDIPATAGGLESVMVPGKLVHVGPVAISTGGAVSNTGLALHRLGAPVRLAGLVGNDVFGRAIRDYVDSFGPGLSAGMGVRDDVASSYSVVVNVPGVDRIFLHCPGANDAFDADVLTDGLLAGAKLLHFGYPPLMRKMFENGGAELEKSLKKAKDAGLLVSLDMARPDPSSPAGRADWNAILRRVLPHVDLFLPSLDEITYMLDGAVTEKPDAAHLRALTDRLLALGTKAVLVKVGSDGAYLRTGPAGEALGGSPAWNGRELASTCFTVEVAGATGSGDCTIAGFLYGLARGFGPEACLRAATAVGACNVERPDATSGIRPWAEVEKRLAGGWARRAPGAWLAGWREGDGAWRSPLDA